MVSIHDGNSNSGTDSQISAAPSDMVSDAQGVTLGESPDGQVEVLSWQEAAASGRDVQPKD